MYFVRAERHEIGSLTRGEAHHQALTEPARPFSPDAADVMLDHIGGYPFALQIYCCSGQFPI